MTLTDEQRLQLAHALTADPALDLGVPTMTIIDRIAPLIEAFIADGRAVLVEALAEKARA